MRKLGGIENIEDFILAIANGADVNGTYKGRFLVENYFVESMRRFQIKLNSKDKNLEKLKALVAAKADLSTLFYTTYPDESESFKCPNLMRLITHHLEMLEIILGSGQAREIIYADTVYWKDIKDLQALMRKTDGIITEMENVQMESDGV